MKTTRGAIAALLGFAMLAIPLTASAHPHHEEFQRGAVRRYQNYRPVPPAMNARANFRVGGPMARDRYFAPPARFAPAPPRGYYGYAPAPVAYGPAPAANCPLSVPYAWYAPAYPPAYYQRSYAAVPPAYGTYGAPIGNGLAALMHQRDGAVMQYQMAMRRGDHTAAKHLANDIHELNGRIANLRGRGYGYSGYSAINTPYVNNYNYAQGYGPGYSGYGSANYGYGNSSLETLVGPLLGNYIH